MALITYALATFAVACFGSNPTPSDTACFAQIMALVSPESNEWSDIYVATARLRAAIAHQNGLRRERGVPMLAATALRSDVDGRIRYWVDTPSHAPDDPTVGNFFVSGNLLFRAHHIDTHSLNHVYRFDGNRLTSVQPYAVWFLENFTGAEITLYRTLSASEVALWQRRDFEALGRDWGHNAPAVHFSTDETFTSAPAQHRNPMVSITVPRARLLEWARSGALWSAVLDPRTFASELVLTPAQLRQLADSDSIRIGSISTP